MILSRDFNINVADNRNLPLIIFMNERMTCEQIKDAFQFNNEIRFEVYVP